MQSSFNLNSAIVAYSDYMDNNFEALKEYCRRTKYLASIEDLADSIYAIQRPIISIIKKEKERKKSQLSREAIARIAKKHLAKNHVDLDESAANAILKWVYWKSWNQGYLQFDEEDFPQ